MSLPRYVMAAQGILNHIAVAKIGKGDKLPTEKGFAKLLDISVITIRRALAELEGRGVVERVHGKGTFLKQPLDSARKQGRIEYVYYTGPGYKYDSVNSPEVAMLKEALQARGYAMGYHILYDMPGKDFIDEISGSSGIITTGFLTKKFVDVMSSFGLPVITIGAWPDILSDCNIRYDFVAATEMATERLIKDGAREILLITGPDNYLPAHEIFQGYREALKKHGIPFLADNVLWVTYDERSSIIRNFLKGRTFDAVVEEEGNILDLLGFYWDNNTLPRPAVASITVKASKEKLPQGMIETEFSENIFRKAATVFFELLQAKDAREKVVAIKPRSWEQ